MNPGATTQPEASSSRSPCRSGPISWISPAVIATSATRPGPPLPSTTVPPRIARSAGISTSVVPRHEELCLVDRGSGGGSTVHGNDDSCDVRRALAGQEDHDVGDVGRRTLALKRLRELNDRAEVVLRDPGRDVTRGDAVHTDPVFGQVRRG